MIYIGNMLGTSKVWEIDWGSWVWRVVYRVVTDGKAAELWRTHHGHHGASKWGQSEEIRWPYPNTAPWNLVQSDLSPLFWLWCGEVATLRTHTSTTTSSVTSSSTTSTSSLAVLSKGAWTTGARGNVWMQACPTKQQMPFTKWLVTAVIPEL